MAQEKANILIVYNYNRHDFLTYFEACKNDFNFFFAEFVSPQEETNQHYLSYGKAVYWGDYRDVFDLLDKVKPTKVLFHYIASKFHILLNTACKIAGIRSYIIDHGIRDININVRLQQYLTPAHKDSSLRRNMKKLIQFLPRAKARLFLIKSIKKLQKQCNSSISAKALQVSSFMYKNPTAYIAISKKTFEYHQFANNISEETTVDFIGIPTFDYLHGLKYKSTDQKRNMIFIDQGLATVGIYGWNEENYKDFQYRFISICQKYGYKLYIKPHPRQPTDTWQYWNHKGIAQIISDSELQHILPNTQLIIGFTSTYLLPLASLPFTTVLTLENHPAGRLLVSKSFVDYGVAYPVYHLDELHHVLPKIDQLHQEQLPNKKKFEEDWLYKFDGKAGQRLRSVLLN